MDICSIHKSPKRKIKLSMKKIVFWISTLFLLFGIAGQAYADFGDGRRGLWAERRGGAENRAETREAVREAARAGFRQRQLDRGAQAPAERPFTGDAVLDNQRDGSRLNRDARDIREERNIRTDHPNVVEEGGRRGRLTIEERRALRRQIREAGHDIYNRQR